MSSFHRRAAALLLLTMVCLSVPAQCQDGSEWDRARAALIVSQPTAMAQVIDRWRLLTASDGYGFADYAGFVLAYPGFPDETKLRLAAEKAIAQGSADTANIVALLDRYPPLTNPARAQYALALAALGRPEAAEVARSAWRGGTMSASAEQTILQNYGARFTTADHDARSNALLWDGNVTQATNMLGRLSPAAQSLAQARLALLEGAPFASPMATPLVGSVVNPVANDASYLSDPGYVYTRARLLMQSGQTALAANLLATHAAFTTIPLDPRKWINLQLAAARGGNYGNTAPENAVRIAERADDSFAPGTDVSQASFPIRDDYTSLIWLGGTQALWILHDPARAATLFYRYGAAGRTPQTRAKGFYWAGRALAQAGETGTSQRYFKSAAAFPDQFYGMLALERLARPLPSLVDPPHPVPSADQRAAFYARPITQAVREVARDADWQTTIRFFREISAQALSESDRTLVAELARNLGRRDLGVVLGQAAGNDDITSFRDVSFPLIPTSPEIDWTIVHAIIRQESQFSQNAISRTGARGLMQLEPGTAQGEANKLGLSYSFSGLTTDPAYNMELGDAVFSHLMTIYNGCYPLAIAAYNSGPGNVNKWLRQNGDPRLGTSDWIDWIEQIPFSETRGYVQHVIENAVVYEALYPAHAHYRGANPASHYLTKRTPG